MGDDGRSKYDAEGVDWASGKSYGVLVCEGSPSEEYSDADALISRNKLLFELKDWREIEASTGAVPDYYLIRAEYHVTGRLCPEYRKHLKARLDRYDTPLPARNDALRLVLDNPAWTAPAAAAAGVVGLRIRVDYWRDESIDRSAIPRRQHDEDDEEDDDDDERWATNEAVNALEFFDITPSELERETSCPICWEEYSLGAESTRMPCSHFFHKLCIVRWLLIEKCFCPLCHFKIPCISKEDSLLDPMTQYYKEFLPDLYVFVKRDRRDRRYSR